MWKISKINEIISNYGFIKEKGVFKQVINNMLVYISLSIKKYTIDLTVKSSAGNFYFPSIDTYETLNKVVGLYKKRLLNE